jgi:hypothetical protein
MWKYYNQAMNSIAHFNNQDWFLIMIGVVIVGMVCMKGFGSRSGY